MPVATVFAVLFDHARMTLEFPLVYDLATYDVELCFHSLSFPFLILVKVYQVAAKNTTTFCIFFAIYKSLGSRGLREPDQDGLGKLSRKSADLPPFYEKKGDQ